VDIQEIKQYIETNKDKEDVKEYLSEITRIPA